MESKQVTELAIKRHDIDADHFQHAYTFEENKNEQSKKEAVFLYGRKLVIDELNRLLGTLPKGSKVLDVGCGTAHLSQWIKNQGFSVSGIEPSVNMYNYAKQNFPDIEIKQAISSAIPFPDDHFDLIVSFEVLRYLDKEENKKTYHEFYRVLKPGGQFFLTQVNKYATDFYYFFHNVKAVYSRITNKVHHYCNFTTPAAEEKLAHDAGFAEVRTIGRFAASSRLFYKAGRGVGRLYSKFIEKLMGNQRFENSAYKKFTGHLIVIGKK